MNALIPTTEMNLNNQLVQLVDARLLHQFLQVGTDFSDWIKRRIQYYGFVENEDYFSELGEGVFPKFEENLGGRPSIEYSLTLNMAKELAMVERTDKGRQARRYFIDCERQLIASLQQPKPLSLEEEIVQRASRYHLGGFNKSMINRFVWQNGSSLAQQSFHRAAQTLCAIMEREKLKHKREQLTIIQGIKRSATAKQRIQDDIDHINWLLAQLEEAQ